MWRRARLWVKSLVGRARFEDELDDELEFHIQARTEQLVSEGMPPVEARRRAQIDFGSVAKIKEEVREVRIGASVERFLQETRVSLRSLVKARGFTSVVIGTLTIGLTLCTVTLTVVNAYFIRELPYPAADRLYEVRYAPPGQEAPANLRSLDWEGLGEGIEQTIAWDLDMFYLLGGARPELAAGAWVTPGFIEGFGIRPTLGRNFAEEDFQSGRPQVALISHRLWRSRFGGDAAVVGRRYQAYVSDRPEEPEEFTIIGVLPEDFWHLNRYTEILAPLRAPFYPYMVQIRDGITPTVAAELLTAVVRAGSGPLERGWRVELVSARSRYVAEMRPLVLAVVLAVGLVFLITAANVATLLLVRMRRRERETAMRLALGGTGAQVAQGLVVEAILLGAAATAAGLVCGRLVMVWLGPLVEQHLGRRVPGGLSGLEMDATVLAGTVAIGLLGTFLFVLASLVGSWRTSLSSVRPGGERGNGSGWLRAPSALIVGEVAASLALLTGSALMVDSALRTLRVDYGIHTERTLTAGVSLRQRSYPDVNSRVTVFERLIERLREVPGLTSVAMSDSWPLQAPRPRGVAPASSGDRVEVPAGWIGVSAHYFQTLGIRVLEGRAFNERDRWESERVAIVSDTLASRLWAPGQVVGQRLRLSSESDARAYLVVGVVTDVRQGHADVDLADVYVPLLQRGNPFAYVLARLPDNDSPASPTGPNWEDEIWSAMSEIDPELSLSPPQMLQAAVDAAQARPRFLASLLSLFAAFTALLALVGIYGVISYAVRQRQREIAVRVAVGADRRSVARLFLREGAILLAGGLMLGLWGALAVGRVLESQLFGVQPGDPWVLTLTALGFGVCGLMSMGWPALRAASVDPAAILRAE